MTNGAQRYEISSENFSTTFNVATPTYEYERNKLPKKSEFSSEISFYGFADVWATLWMILSIATLMLLIYFIIVITRSIYRFEHFGLYFSFKKEQKCQVFNARFQNRSSKWLLLCKQIGWNWELFFHRTFASNAEVISTAARIFEYILTPTQTMDPFVIIILNELKET